MRKGLGFGLVALGFILGAWISPGLTAQTSEGEWLPLRPIAGQTVSVSVPIADTCVIQRVARHWVQCKGGAWRNLITGVGYSLQDYSRPGGEE